MADTVANRGGQRPLEPLTPQEAAFQFAEFGALKAEVSELLKGNAANFQYAVLASAGVLAWIASVEKIVGHVAVVEVNPVFLRYVLWLPFVVSVFFGAVNAGIWYRIVVIGRYLQELEIRVAAASLGWQSYFAKTPVVFGTLYVVGWVALLGGTFALAIFPPASFTANAGANTQPPSAKTTPLPPSPPSTLQPHPP